MLDVAGGILIAAWVLSWFGKPGLSKEEKAKTKAKILRLNEKMKYWESLKSHPNYRPQASLKWNMENCK